LCAPEALAHACSAGNRRGRSSIADFASGLTMTRDCTNSRFCTIGPPDMTEGVAPCIHLLHTPSLWQGISATRGHMLLGSARVSKGEEQDTRMQEGCLSNFCPASCIHMTRGAPVGHASSVAKLGWGGQIRTSGLGKIKGLRASTFLFSIVCDRTSHPGRDCHGDRSPARLCRRPAPWHGTPEEPRRRGRTSAALRSHTDQQDRYPAFVEHTLRRGRARQRERRHDGVRGLCINRHTCG
jgi:hypothetical protein